MTAGTPTERQLLPVCGVRSQTQLDLQAESDGGQERYSNHYGLHFSLSRSADAGEPLVTSNPPLNLI